MRFLLFLAVLFIGAFLVAAICLPSAVWAQQDGAASAISAAQSKLVQCYDAARAAEATGANISRLTLSLNSAGLLLSRAQLFYSNGEFGSAQSLAAQSQGELASFVSDANSLQASAAQSRTFDFLVHVVGSILGTVAVVIGSVVVWRLLNRKYGNSGVQKGESEAA